MIRAKALVKDKFWIVEQNGQKLGTLQKKENNGWIYLNKLEKETQVYPNTESLINKYDDFDLGIIICGRTQASFVVESLYHVKNHIENMTYE